MKIYVETTIISYMAGRPSRNEIIHYRQKVSHDWWQSDKPGDEIYSSQQVIKEASAGDPEVAARRLKYLAMLPILPTTEKATALVERILRLKILPERAADDALHIAIAATEGMDALLTWNCRHMTNPILLKGVKRFFLEEGILLPTVCSPVELVDEQEYEV